MMIHLNLIALWRKVGTVFRLGSCPSIGA